MRVVALDKTGTLTHGRPGRDRRARRRRAPRTPTTSARLAASIDAASEHPVAHAIVARLARAAARRHGLRGDPGRGVAATVDGVRYHLGNHRLAEERRRCSPALEAVLDGFEEDAKTAIVLMTTTTACRRDRRRRHDPRPSRRPAVAALRGARRRRRDAHGRQRPHGARRRPPGRHRRGPRRPAARRQAAARRASSATRGPVGDDRRRHQRRTRARDRRRRRGDGRGRHRHGDRDRRRRARWTTTRASIAELDPTSPATRRTCCGRTSRSRSPSRRVFFGARRSPARASLWIAVLADMGASLRRDRQRPAAAAATGVPRTARAAAGDLSRA